MKNRHKRILTILNNAYCDCGGFLSLLYLRVLVKKITQNKDILMSEALNELRTGMATGEYGVLLVLIEFVNDHSRDQDTSSIHWKQFVALVTEMNTELFSMLRKRDCVAA